MSARRGSDRGLEELLGFDPLAEGFAVGREEAASLRQVAEALSVQHLPPRNPEAEERLAETLQSTLVAQVTSTDDFRTELEQEWGEGGLRPLLIGLAILQPQIRLLRAPFWLASGLVVLLGLPLISPRVQAALGLQVGYGGFLVMIAPVLAALGVAYAFRSAGTGMAEVELTCPLTPAQLLLGRLFWVAAYDAVLLGSGSLVAASLEPGISLGYLVLGWLAPLLLATVTALALSFLLPIWAGAAGVLTLWSIALTVGLNRPAWFLPEMAGGPAILLPALLLSGMALLLFGWLVASAPRLLQHLAEKGRG